MEAGFLPPSFWRRAGGKELCTGATSQITSKAEPHAPRPAPADPVTAFILCIKTQEVDAEFIKLQKHPQTNCACARMMGNVLKKQSLNSY